MSESSSTTATPTKMMATRSQFSREVCPFSPASVVSGGFYATCGRGQTLKKTLLAEVKKPGQNNNQNVCNCTRSNTSVLCRSCGTTFKGRVRMPCPIHPNTIHLMDLVYCPSCRATTLKEFSYQSSRPKSRTTRQL